MLNDLKTQREWDIQLTIAISFFSSKVSNKTHTIHSKSDNRDVMISNETSKELFDSLLQKHQKDLQESVKDSEFVFDSVNLLHYKFHKISLNCGGSYIYSPKWLKSQKSNNKS